MSPQALLRSGSVCESCHELWDTKSSPRSRDGGIGAEVLNPADVPWPGALSAGDFSLLMEQTQTGNLCRLPRALGLGWSCVLNESLMTWTSQHQGNPTAARGEAAATAGAGDSSGASPGQGMAPLNRECPLLAGNVPSGLGTWPWSMDQLGSSCQSRIWPSGKGEAVNSHWDRAGVSCSRFCECSFIRGQ